MNQELQYLRDDLNQRVILHNESANKTINMVLLIWGGSLILLGNGGLKFTEISLENIPSYFFIGTIFFISNLILYYTARKYYNAANSMFELAAYITVFYEKRPSKTNKVGKNFSWELATFEKVVNKRHEKSIHKKNVEYAALTRVSVVFMSVFLVLLVINIFTVNGVTRIACIIVSLIYIIYLGISIRWLWEIPKYTYARDNYKMRRHHLKYYIRYALNTGHYTKKEIKDKFGDILNFIGLK